MHLQWVRYRTEGSLKIRHTAVTREQLRTGSKGSIHGYLHHFIGHFTTAVSRCAASLAAQSKLGVSPRWCAWHRFTGVNSVVNDRAAWLSLLSRFQLIYGDILRNVQDENFQSIKHFSIGY